MAFGDVWQVESLAASGLDVYAHNIETVHPTLQTPAMDNKPLPKNEI